MLQWLPVPPTGVHASPSLENGVRTQMKSVSHQECARPIPVCHFVLP